MRLPAFLSTAVVVMLSGVAVAQSSPPFYVNTEYRFAAIFPGEPIAADVTYTNASGDSYPARQFVALQDSNRHVVTVVDISTGLPIDLNLVEHATDELRRKGEVRFQAYDDYDPGVPGRQLNIFEADGRQLRASVYMWDHRLYITEATGVPGSSSLLQFEQSITLLNADGSEVNLDGDGDGRGP
jgi:hypothetical protein